MNPPSERRFPLIASAKADTGVSPGAVAFLEDIIDACVMESYFREHMAERDLLFHDTVAPQLAAYAPEASAAQQRDWVTHLHQTFNAPSHPIANRLLRLTADSPDLLTIINPPLYKKEVRDALPLINRSRSQGGRYVSRRIGSRD